MPTGTVVWESDLVRDIEIIKKSGSVDYKTATRTTNLTYHQLRLASIKPRELRAAPV